MTVKDKVSISVRFGITNKKRSYTSDVGAAQDALRAALLKRVKDVEKAIAKGTIEEMEVAIVDAVEHDLAKYAKQVANFFTSQRASTSGFPRLIYPSQDMETGAQFSGRIVKLLESQHFVDNPLFWQALAASTMKRKKRLAGAGATTYFLFTGQLRNYLTATLGATLSDIFEPKVTFTAASEQNLTTGRFQTSKKLGSVNVRLFRQGAQINDLQGALTSGDWSNARNDDNLLHAYMVKLAAEKLGNPRMARTPSKRPWVGPSIAFWVINRAPSVVAAAIEKAVKERKR